MNGDSGIALTELRVDGGAARNDLLMQMQADLLGVPVVRPRVSESTALGAAGRPALPWASGPARTSSPLSGKPSGPSSQPGRNPCAQPACSAGARRWSCPGWSNTAR